MVNKNNNFQDSVLEVLSFYEEMNWERIVMDFEEEFLKENPELNKEVLENILVHLSKKKLIQMRKNDKGEKHYKRLFPKKSFWRKLREIINI
jgi:hypothetical protein